MLKIVVLDGATLNPGDLDWSPLEFLGDTVIHNNTEDTDVLSRAIDADILLVNKIKLDHRTLKQLPNLKYIGLLATGYDNVDIFCAKERGIPVTNAAGYSTESVAQHTFALILELTNKTKHHSSMVHLNAWMKQKNFAYWDRPLLSLNGKVLGLFGFGSIGKEVAKIAFAFGMKVIFHSPTKHKVQNCDWVDLKTLWSSSDFLTLHAPLLLATRNIVNGSVFSQMKQSAFLINTSRGGLVNLDDLSIALENKLIAGAALDVLPLEPPQKDRSIFYSKNCIITPHIAWANNSSRQNLLDIVVSNIRSYIDGNPVNIVNK